MGFPFQGGCLYPLRTFSSGIPLGKPDPQGGSEIQKRARNSKLLPVGFSTPSCQGALILTPVKGGRGVGFQVEKGSLFFARIRLGVSPKPERRYPVHSLINTCSRPVSARLCKPGGNHHAAHEPRGIQEESQRRPRRLLPGRAGGGRGRSPRHRRRGRSRRHRLRDGRRRERRRNSRSSKAQTAPTRATTTSPNPRTTS